MVNVLSWLVAGGVVGWVASRLMLSDGQQGLILNIVVGMLGAVIGGWFISPLFGLVVIDLGAFNMGAFMASLIGAFVLLAILNLVHRSTVG